MKNAKFEVVLGNSMPVVLQEQAGTYKANTMGRNVLDSSECDDAGCAVSPDFGRVTVILREPAFGQAKKVLPGLIENLVVGGKYVRVEHRTVSGKDLSLCLAPVLKKAKADKELVDYEDL